MSVKIKVSYTTDEEFNRIREQLFPLIRKWKKPSSAKGAYKKAYSCTESGCKCAVLVNENSKKPQK